MGSPELLSCLQSGQRRQAGGRRSVRGLAITRYTLSIVLMCISNQRKGTSYERNRHFEVRTTDGTSDHRWLPRNGVGNSRCMWCLVSQGYHRPPRFLRTGAGRYPYQLYKWWTYACFERLYRTGRTIQRYRGEQA